MFWLWTSSSNFYEAFESPNITFAPTKYQNYDSTGQHNDNVWSNRETSSYKKHRNPSRLTFGICNKVKTIGHGTSTNHQVFRYCNRLDSNNSSRKDNEKLYKNAKQYPQRRR